MSFEDADGAEDVGAECAGVERGTVGEGEGASCGVVLRGRGWKEMGAMGKQGGEAGSVDRWWRASILMDTWGPVVFVMR